MLDCSSVWPFAENLKKRIESQRRNLLVRQQNDREENLKKRIERDVAVIGLYFYAEGESQKEN